MKRFAILLLVALCAAPALATSYYYPNVPTRCRTAGPYLVFCFTEPFIVDAYSSANTAMPAVDAAGKHWWMLTTNDQTRRAIVIHPWDYSRGPLPNIGSDGYVAELYPSSDVALARWRSLEEDQRAGGFLIPVPAELYGGGMMVVFRTFSRAFTIFDAPEVPSAAR